MHKCYKKLFVLKHNTALHEELWAQENGNWTKVEKPASMAHTEKPPPKETGFWHSLKVATENNKLYLIGGWDTSKNKGVTDVWALDCVKLADGDNANGAAWEKHALALKEGIFGPKVCLNDNKLAVIQGLKEVNTNNQPVMNFAIQIYDLANPNNDPAEVELDSIYPDQAICIKGMLYLRYFDNEPERMKIKKINMKDDPITLTDVADSTNQQFSMNLLDGKLIQVGFEYDDSHPLGFQIDSKFQELSDNGAWIEKCLPSMNGFPMIATRLPLD